MLSGKQLTEASYKMRKDLLGFSDNHSTELKFLIFISGLFYMFAQYTITYMNIALLSVLK
jgi:hypothetical protein